MDQDKPEVSADSSVNELSLRSATADLSSSYSSQANHIQNLTIDTSVTVVGAHASVSHSLISVSINPVTLGAGAQVHGDINIALGALLPHTYSSIIYLPSAVDGYLPRATILTTMQEKLSQQSGAIKTLALVGVSGAGKSELAAAFARNDINSQSQPSQCTSSSSSQMPPDSEDSKPILAYFIDARKDYYLASFESLADLLNIDVNVLRKRYKPDATPENKKRYEEQLATRLNQALRRYGRWILIYDNVQSLEDLRKLTPNIQGLQGLILYTSQDTMLFDSQRRVEVSGMTEDEATALFEHFTGLQDKEGALALAESLDRLPLAIQVAGRYIRHQREEVGTDMGYKAYQDLHRATLESLDAAQAAICGRQNIPQTQYAAIKLSIDNLNPAGKQLLTFLGLFERRNLPETLLCAYTKTYLGQKHSDVGIEVDIAIKSLRQYGLLNREDASHKTWFLHQVTHDYVNYFCIDLSEQMTQENLQLLQHGATILQSEAITQIKQQVYKHALSFFYGVMTIPNEHIPHHFNAI